MRTDLVERPTSEDDPTGGAGSRYRAALALLASRQKPGAGVPAYTRWVNRRAARRIAAAAHALGVSANTVTILSAAVSALAVVALLALPTGWVTGVVVAVLLAAGYVLDSADGQVARLSGTAGPSGEWLDHVVDAIRTPVVHLAVLVALARDGAPDWALVVTLAYCVLAVGQFMSQILAEQLLGRPPLPATGPARRQSLVLLPTDTGTFCWLFVLWGGPVLFVAAYTSMFALNLFHAAVSMRRKYVRLRLHERKGPTS
ncbi:CDP-alcohol phosphatidyltransferase family protein [Cellulomonas bogoriensis]|uniref:CDP-alcohol phosphatidyltransferase n=1 Tax=Cellulomonas bogoriensis 69B4 = DSM 16987 TaxID=1386082 RepID=A0A0A0C3J0_9CELL|nr:CDP-alcohol phosphatidyltransferase family protein [Cellulomonas bogoriensis]KGM13949.1 CDP-alcohol phosphatidyltransferase [Cellulomonas bogoriensis 69B4 = DSM 16987]